MMPAPFVVLMQFTGTELAPMPVNVKAVLYSAGLAATSSSKRWVSSVRAAPAASKS